MPSWGTLLRTTRSENRGYSPGLLSRNPRSRVNKIPPVLNSTTKVATTAAFSYCPANHDIQLQKRKGSAVVRRKQRHVTDVSSGG